MCKLSDVFPFRILIALESLNFTVMVSGGSFFDNKHWLSSTFQGSHYFLREVIISLLKMTGVVIFLWLIMIGEVTVLGKSLCTPDIAHNVISKHFKSTKKNWSGYCTTNLKSFSNYFVFLFLLKLLTHSTS